MPDCVIVESADSHAAAIGSMPAFTSPIKSPSAPNTRVARGSSVTRVLFLKVSHFSAKSAVSSPTPRIVSPVMPATSASSSSDSAPESTAATNCAAPRVPNT